MLPAIEARARIAFRFLKGDERDKAVQETICNACCVFDRLARTWTIVPGDGADSLTPSLHAKDVCSTHCRLRTGVVVPSLLRENGREDLGQEPAVFTP